MRGDALGVVKSTYCGAIDVPRGTFGTGIEPLGALTILNLGTLDLHIEIKRIYIGRLIPFLTSSTEGVKFWNSIRSGLLWGVVVG